LTEDLKSTKKLHQIGATKQFGLLETFGRKIGPDKIKGVFGQKTLKLCIFQSSGTIKCDFLDGE
jgi:hypothetical protein